MKRSWLIRGAAFGAGAILLAGFLAPRSAQETIAGWTDRQEAKTEFKAATAPGVAVECANIPGSSAVRISWLPGESLADGASISYRVRAINGSAVNVISNNQTATQIDISKGTLAAIIGGLLGGSQHFNVHVQTLHTFGGTPSSEWHSLDAEDQFVGVAPKYGLGIVVIGYKCA